MTRTFSLTLTFFSSPATLTSKTDPKNTLKIFIKFFRNFNLQISIKAQPVNTNLAKFLTSTFHPKTLWFFFWNFSFNFHFFSEHPKFHTYIFPPLSTLWKFFFGHLDFFSLKKKTLRFFLRHYTDTWHLSLTSRKNLANVHPRTIEKFLLNIECNWHLNFFNKPKLLKAI